MARFHGAFFIALIVQALGLAACGGGGGGGSSTLGTPCCPSTTPTPTVPPTGASATTVLPAGGGALTIPLFAGYSGTVNAPAPTLGGGTSVTIADQTTTPAGLLALTTVRRSPLGNTPLFYFSITPAATVTFPSTPGFTIAVPPPLIGGSAYFLSSWTGTAWTLPGDGPGTLSGSTLTFAPILNSGPVTLGAGVTQWFALYFTAAATPTPSPSPSPSPTPTPTPLAVSSRPLKAGDAWSYAGASTLTQVFARTTPTPIAVTVSQVTQSVSVSGGASFNGQSGLFDVKTVEVDTSPLQAITVTTDAFLTTVPSGGGNNLISWGYTSLDSLGESLNVQYGASAASILLDRLPEVANDSWTNSPAERIHEISPGNQTSVRTYAGDGSYTDTTTYATSQTASIVEHADGSGTYSVPFFGGSNSTLTFSTPSPGGVITVGGFSNGSRTANIWYPVPLHLYSETDQNLGTVAIPAACNAAGGFGSQANALSLSTQRVDTILGSIETLAQTTYVIPTYGAVCVALTDIVTSYYDFSGGAPRIAISSTPVETQTLVTTLGLTSATVSSNGRIVLSGGSGWRIANARANFVAIIERRRIERQRRVFDALQRMLRDGGRR